MAFSDFPTPQRQCYPSGAEYLQYLKDYASHFDLERCIRYNTKVESASLSKSGIWRLELHELETGNCRFFEADALIVATGAHQVPKTLPTQLSNFSGRVVHSSNYTETFRQHVKAQKARVLLVGGGESGADIAADLGDLTPNTAVWLRRPNCFGPRFLVSDSEMPQVRACKNEEFPVNSFLESATTNRMSAAQNVYFYGFWRRLLWKMPILNRMLSRACLDSTASAPLMNDQATYVTKNQRMCEAWEDEKIEVLITLTVSAKGTTVTFTMDNGTILQREFDVVVLCTGYSTAFPWLKVDGFNPNPRSWYLHCFPENLGHSLAFVGYARPHQGGIPPMAEMLSRYVALILAGRRRLPVDYSARALRDGITEREYYSISSQLDSLVDWNAFLESVARRVGCEPRLPMSCVVAFNVHMLASIMLALQFFQVDLNFVGLQYTALLWTGTLISFFLLQNGLLIKWWFYPHWMIWYRQRGPGSDPQLFETMLHRVNIWRCTAITRGFVLLVFWSWWTYYAQWVLSFLLFIPYKLARGLGIRIPRAWGGFLVPKMFALHDNEWRLSDLVLP
jgi:dimethylaniline monooxygenase (N-oxide forming)